MAYPRLGLLGGLNVLVDAQNAHFLLDADEFKRSAVAQSGFDPLAEPQQDVLPPALAVRIAERAAWSLRHGEEQSGMLKHKVAFPVGQFHLFGRFRQTDEGVALAIVAAHRPHFRDRRVHDAAKVEAGIAERFRDRPSFGACAMHLGMTNLAA